MTKRQVTTKGSFMEQKKKELKGVYAQLHKEQQLLLSQFSFDNFVEYIRLDEKGKYAKQAEIHMSWTQFIEDCWKDRINPAILAPWGHGKSVMKSIGLLNSSGVYKEIGSYAQPTKLFGVDRQGKMNTYDCSNVRQTGYGKLLKITTRTGRTIECTSNHPILGFFEWIDADKLKVGDPISVLKKYTINNTKPILEDLGYLLGVTLGDGGIITGTVIHNSNEGVSKEINRICNKFGWTVHHGTNNKGAFRWTISNKNKVVVSFKDILISYKLFGCNSYSKKVPEEIFMAQDCEVIKFLAGYFDTDGSYDMRNSIEYFSVSKQLLEGTQHLLGRFGIVSYLKKKNGRYNGNVHKSYRLVLSGVDTINFYNLVENYLHNQKKKNQVETIISSLLSKKRNANYDTIPLNWLKYLNTSVDCLRKKFGIRIGKYKYGTTRELVQRVSDVENNEFLKIVLNCDLMWDNVVSIEESNILQPVYDVEVDDVHNFIANGIIAHNSMQQAIGRPLFELGRDLNLRIKIVCNSANNATKRVTTLKNYIEQSNRLHEVFPHVVPGFDHWTNTSLNVAGRLFSDVDHSIESYGIESRAVGGRADLIIFDDVVDDKSEQSPAHRKMVKDNFENVFMSRLEPEGRVIFIGTMWHVDDLNANLIGSPGWRFMIQGVSENFKCIEEVII